MIFYHSGAFRRPTDYRALIFSLYASTWCSIKRINCGTAFNQADAVIISFYKVKTKIASFKKGLLKRNIKHFSSFPFNPLSIKANFCTNPDHIGFSFWYDKTLSPSHILLVHTIFNLPVQSKEPISQISLILKQKGGSK